MSRGFTPEGKPRSPITERSAPKHCPAPFRSALVPYAMIALARKFLEVICGTLRHNWIFDNSPRFVLASGRG